MTLNAKISDANKILKDYGLIEKLSQIGEVHMTGSYYMDMIVVNDIDINVNNSEMEIEKLYDLSSFILKTFCPKWYEAKEEVNSDGNIVWFHGFETEITGELWNIDIWFFDEDQIKIANGYCDGVIRQIKDNPKKKNVIEVIKKDLIELSLYSYDNYSSVDVYEAVLNRDIKNVEDLIKVLKPRKDRDCS